MASPIPFQPAVRDFALLRTRDQWRRCAHQETAVAPGGVVELSSHDDAGAPPATGAPGLGGGLAFDAHCRLYRSGPAEGQVERILWAALRPFEAPPASEPVDVFAAAVEAPLGDFGAAAPAGGPVSEPRGLAVDAPGRLFVAERGAGRVLVYDPARRRLLRAIPIAGGSGGDGPRPVDLAAAGEVVYCVTDAGTLLALTAFGPPRPVPLPAGWTPVRVATRSDGAVALLDRAAGRVRFLEGAADEIALPPRTATQPGPESATDLEFLDDRTVVVAHLPGDDFFRFPAVTADEAAQIDVAVGPLKARGYDGLGIVRTPDGHIGFFGQRGFREAAPVRRRFALEGGLVTFALDAGDFQVQWGRLFLDACVPDGTDIQVFAATADEVDPDEATFDRTPPALDDLAHPPLHPELSPALPPLRLGPDQVPGGATWIPLHRRESGRELPWAQPRADDPFATYECPVLAGPGRLLWVWFRLRGDGQRSPRIRCLRAERPGHELLRKLPRAFSRDLAVGDFLRRYLAVGEGMLGELDARGSARAALLAPFATPDELLPWLASFMGLVLDGRFTTAQRRLLVSEIANLWRAKGTVCGLARFLEIYLGVRPIIVEAFRLRGLGGTVLGSDCAPRTTSVLGAGFQVGGDARAASEGPLAPAVVRDAFETRAHRFTVIVPGHLTQEQEAVVRFLLDTQRPAHTFYELCTVANGTRVGKALHVRDLLAGRADRRVRGAGPGRLCAGPRRRPGPPRARAQAGRGAPGRARPERRDADRMSELLHIGRLRARYRIRGDAAQARARLDAVLGRMLDAPLEAAIRRLDLPEGEELCVRALRAPVQLSLDGSDAAVAEAWSEALALALRRAIADGRDVLRFRSRPHALLDLVASAARGDLSRGWAWAQLGLWDEPAQGSARTGEAIAAALCGLPEAAPAALAEAARRGALPALAARVSPAGWRRVAAAALQAFETGAPALAALEEPPAGEDETAPEPDVAARAARIAGRSSIPELLRREPRGVAPAAVRPLLALAALAAEPEALRRPRPEALLAALERFARPALPARSDPDRERDRERASSSAAAPAARESGAPAGEPGRELPGSAPSDGAAPDGPPVVARAAGRTRAGGLLFLLWLVSELGLPETLCQEGTPLGRRSLRFGLHALALSLLPIEARNPAALAFCGLGPDNPPPDEDQEPLSDAERTALESAAADLSAALRLRLGRADEPARAVLLETCRRDAEIVLDPGWLEVRYALDDVDVRVRRAGLDLDPGWLPWLGCAVRFVYA